MGNIIKYLLCVVCTILGSNGWTQPTIKVGVLGAMSGPAKYWGLTNYYCALATAKMYNQKGGVKIGNETYTIEIHQYDTELTPAKATIGAKKLLIDNDIRYIIGPNIDDTSFAIIPHLEANNAINISYGFSEKLYQPPRNNTYLGMIHPSITAPTIYKYLIDQHQIETIAFLARQDKESLNQRNKGVEAARKLGLEVKEIDAWDISDATYPANLTGLNELAQAYAALNTDLIVLSGSTPADTSKLIRALRQQGYRGFLSTETAQDPKLLLAAIPDLNKFVTLGSSPPKSNQSDYMADFIKEYKQIAGTWHDEAGVKVYALEFILRVLQEAGPEALEQTERFIATAANFNQPDPFSKQPRQLQLTGGQIFDKEKQLSVPFTITIINQGKATKVTL